MTTDIIIIGGGAAGLLSAVYLKKQNPKLNIRILEALPRVTAGAILQIKILILTVITVKTFRLRNMPLINMT